ncbi:hypothetical protein BCA37_23520 [Mycobacterium sp. djl-10]|nr:hypothetical protein BCA37_23520 [Mycobacterium sp. djl-10]
MACRADRTAARWRGGLVGACSAALSIAAHGAGGGEVPGGAALALLILGSAAVGVAAGGLARGVGALAAILVAGQAMGHLTLVLAAGHLHGVGVTAPMLAAHLGAALACAALIGVAEGLLVALAGLVWRLVQALTGDAPSDLTRRSAVPEACPLAAGVQLGCTAGTRGPPLLFV